MPQQRQRASSMDAAEFAALRHSQGLSLDALAGLLACKPQSIRNIESGSTRISTPMARLMTILTHPKVRVMLPDIFLYKEKILKEQRNSP